MTEDLREDLELATAIVEHNREKDFNSDKEVVVTSGDKEYTVKNC